MRIVVLGGFELEGLDPKGRSQHFAAGELVDIPKSFADRAIFQGAAREATPEDLSAHIAQHSAPKPSKRRKAETPDPEPVNQGEVA